MGGGLRAGMMTDGRASLGNLPRHGALTDDTCTMMYERAPAPTVTASTLPPSQTVESDSTHMVHAAARRLRSRFVEFIPVARQLVRQLMIRRERDLERSGTKRPAPEASGSGASPAPKRRILTSRRATRLQEAAAAAATTTATTSSTGRSSSPTPGQGTTPPTTTSRVRRRRRPFGLPSGGQSSTRSHSNSPERD